MHGGDYDRDKLPALRINCYIAGGSHAIYSVPRTSTTGLAC